MIRYTSENGYTGYLYGKSSMSVGIEKEDGMFKECLHTGSRSVDTLEYLKEMVDTFFDGRVCPICREKENKT